MAASKDGAAAAARPEARWDLLPGATLLAGAPGAPPPRPPWTGRVTAASGSLGLPMVRSLCCGRHAVRVAGEACRLVSRRLRYG